VAGERVRFPARSARLSLAVGLSENRFRRACSILFRFEVRPPSSAFQVKADKTSNTPRAYRRPVTDVCLPCDSTVTFRRRRRRPRSHSFRTLDHATSRAPDGPEFEYQQEHSGTRAIEGSERWGSLPGGRPQSSRGASAVTAARHGAMSTALLRWRFRKWTREAANMMTSLEVEFSRLPTGVASAGFPL
jgi:hypothetical protein